MASHRPVFLPHSTDSGDYQARNTSNTGMSAQGGALPGGSASNTGAMTGNDAAATTMMSDLHARPPPAGLATANNASSSSKRAEGAVISGSKKQRKTAHAPPAASATAANAGTTTTTTKTTTNPTTTGVIKQRAVLLLPPPLPPPLPQPPTWMNCATTVTPVNDDGRTVPTAHGLVKLAAAQLANPIDTGSDAESGFGSGAAAAAEAMADEVTAEIEEFRNKCHEKLEKNDSNWSDAEKSTWAHITTRWVSLEHSIAVTEEGEPEVAIGGHGKTKCLTTRLVSICDIPARNLTTKVLRGLISVLKLGGSRDSAGSKQAQLHLIASFKLMKKTDDDAEAEHDDGLMDDDATDIFMLTAVNNMHKTMADNAEKANHRHQDKMKLAKVNAAIMKLNAAKKDHNRVFYRKTMLEQQRISLKSHKTQKKRDLVAVQKDNGHYDKIKRNKALKAKGEMLLPLTQDSVEDDIQEEIEGLEEAISKANFELLKAETEEVAAKHKVDAMEAAAKALEEKKSSVPLAAGAGGNGADDKQATASSGSESDDEA